MNAIADTPINSAHVHWRLAESKLYTGQQKQSLCEFNTVIELLERAKLHSQDGQSICCINKQIEFHKRRIHLLASFHTNAEIDDNNSLNEDGFELLKGVVKEIGEDSMQVIKEFEPMLAAVTVEDKILEANIVDKPNIDLVEIKINPEIRTDTIQTNIQLSNNSLGIEDQLKLYLARIAELESENRALSESLQKERTEKCLLMTSIKDLTQFNN
ncbi:hypothetical protein LOD99_5808 [Oopsacas minuta]|uniref:Uncharacterized protein n=1 Tax=Oopsacas minuta TaxID=111878 RepID=A0AAV7JQ46_9METZ|nr:hypothetical protein LOD99_5808 [Oopsacas minuta]